MERKKLPDELECDEMPPGSFTTVDLEEDEDHMLEFCKAISRGVRFQMYTQVDSMSDNDRRLYSKGMRTVNRTGVYALVPMPGGPQ